MNSKELLVRSANNVRILVASMVEGAKSGHPGGAMGGADFITVLYSEFLRYNPSDPTFRGRDRFFLDPGHMAPMLYAQLCLNGFFTIDDLRALRQWGSVTPGHPERDLLHGIENTSGPLGQGHVFAVGAAIASKWMNARCTPHNPTIYAYISDGGVQEEISQGAGRLAGHLQLDNLVVFYDANDVQLSTRCHEVTSEDVCKKYEAWGWATETINGNDIEAIRNALKNAQKSDKPYLIVGRTAMGKGCVAADGTPFEGQCSTHGQPLSKSGADFKKTIEKLGGNPEQPFEIFPEVKELFEKRKSELNSWVKDYRAQYDRWAQTHPEEAHAYDTFFNSAPPKVEWENISQKKDSATRSASAVVLGHLAKQIPNMLVASADLSNSDKTDGFLAHTRAISKEDWSGQFLQVGVSELTMACVCIGMALHGGVIPACGTFFVFSDYMKPAVRMAALMELPVIFIWTHDSFRVGEDGPTHEPVEQEAQIRLMEQLQNHSGRPSMLVLRPADADETTHAWHLAINNKKTPTALILTRQDVPTLPKNSFQDVEKGAYIVSQDTDPQIVLLASGSEVGTLLLTAERLRRDGVRVQVVSVPSEGLFRQQNADYQQNVLPPVLKKFGLTAGLPITLQSLVGTNGTVFGMRSFGFSAPYKILDEKLGFTPENIYEQVKKIL